MFSPFPYRLVTITFSEGWGVEVEIRWLQVLTPATSSSVFAGFTAVSDVSTVCAVKDGVGNSGLVTGCHFFLTDFSQLAAFTATL